MFVSHGTYDHYDLHATGRACHHRDLSGHGRHLVGYPVDTVVVAVVNALDPVSYALWSRPVEVIVGQDRIRLRPGPTPQVERSNSR